MSDRSILKNFYNQTEEDSASEDDSDFVPDESDGEDNFEDDESEENEKEITKRTIDKVEEHEKSSKNLEEPSTKKSRIDAIWADMNRLAAKKKEETVKLETKIEMDNEKCAAVSAKEKQKEEPLRQKKPSIVRPKSSLSSLVSRYNIKVPKMNTLDASKRDWNKYVDREGIREDLKYKNKDGYMEKVEFLQRVDDRRLNQLKAGQKASKKYKPE
ncbi:BCNT-domain-containing protein [Backusella circina FSU 941]|nr:BCNT-domain-containing protein [Backusella circina FSU 941]